jgi:hypothetical protein
MILMMERERLRFRGTGRNMALLCERAVGREEKEKKKK